MPRCGSGQRIELAGESGLLAGGRVAVNDALAHGAVEGADGLEDGGLRLGRLADEGRSGVLDGCADATADGAVALPPLFVLPYPLDRGPRVGHEHIPPNNLNFSDTRPYRRGARLSRSLSP